MAVGVADVGGLQVAYMAQLYELDAGEGTLLTKMCAEASSHHQPWEPAEEVKDWQPVYGYDQTGSTYGLKLLHSLLEHLQIWPGGRYTAMMVCAIRSQTIAGMCWPVTHGKAVLA